MNDELLIESVLSAHRERGPGGVIREHPAWHDLGPDGRAEAHERTRSLRMLEAALDPRLADSCLNHSHSDVRRFSLAWSLLSHASTRHLLDHVSGDYRESMLKNVRLHG